MSFTIEIIDASIGIIEKAIKGIQSMVSYAIFRVAIITKYIVAVMVHRKAICFAFFRPYFTTMVFLFARLSLFFVWQSKCYDKK